MEFYREGGSGKHLGDIAGILQNPSVVIDHLWLGEKVDSLGLQDVWNQLTHKGGNLPLKTAGSNS